MKDTMKVWISKYALTKGVYEEIVEVSPNIPEMAVCIDNRLQTFHGSDWHLTPDLAIKKAEKMRVSKLDSLQKQLDKLNDLNFTA